MSNRVCRGGSRNFTGKSIEPLQLVPALASDAFQSHMPGSASPDPVRTSEALSAGALSVLDRSAEQAVADARVLVIAWVHGCIGLYFWLRMKAFFKRAAPFLLAPRC